MLFSRDSQSWPSRINDPDALIFRSPDALRGAKKNITFGCIGDESDLARKYLEGERNIDGLFDDLDRVYGFWEGAFEAYNQNAQFFEMRIEKGGLTFEIYFSFNQPLRICIDVINSSWAKERLEWMKRVFNDEGLDETRLKDSDYKLKIIADRLQVVPMTEFKAVQDFEPIIEDYDHGIDWRVMELVRLMQMMNIDSRNSCQGHREKGDNLPYIGFGTKNIERVLALLLSLRGLFKKSCFDIEFHGKYATQLVIRPSHNTPLREAQGELDRMTDFLRGKLEHQRPYIPTMPEKMHRIRRKVLGLLPDSKVGTLVDMAVERFEEGVEFHLPKKWPKLLRNRVEKVLGVLQKKTV